MKEETPIIGIISSRVAKAMILAGELRQANIKPIIKPKDIHIPKDKRTSLDRQLLYQASAASVYFPYTAVAVSKTQILIEGVKIPNNGLIDKINAYELKNLIGREISPAILREVIAYKEPEMKTPILLESLIPGIIDLRTEPYERSSVWDLVAKYFIPPKNNKPLGRFNNAELYDWKLALPDELSAARKVARYALRKR